MARGPTPRGYRVRLNTPAYTLHHILMQNCRAEKALDSRVVFG